MYEKYIDEFMPSKDMREYLKTQVLNGYEIASLIFKSPKPINEKLNYLESLIKENVNDNLHYW